VFASLGLSWEFDAMDEPDDDSGLESRPLHLRPETRPLDASVLFALPAAGRISSRFGMRRHPISGVWKGHAGVDVAAPIGTEIRATGAGTVAHAGWVGGYGKTVIIDHGSGMTTLYAHMSVIHASRRQLVVAGDLIGEVGTTGRSTGPHVHYEVRRDGVAVDPLA